MDLAEYSVLPQKEQDLYAKIKKKFTIFSRFELFGHYHTHFTNSVMISPSQFLISKQISKEFAML